ncbi:MAG TPA: peptidase MA family metallohydrolase, partial [Candidatus Wunengus sp. YC65]|uniref:peptidase MA family metallohydrolase n=1 Tax=Candidatus Wunengus sp. YC65 TaxID=3367701 RepID=UPI004025B393
HRETFRSLVSNEMIAAFAIPGQDLIVLDYSQFRYDSLTLKLIIMHEMCHLLLHKNIAGNNLPRWFDEGVSQWVSGGINEIVYPQSTDVLKRAFISDTLLPFSTISEALPSDPVNLILSYEQSRSMVDYIEQRYGIDSIKGIILRLSSGVGFYEAVSDELGTDFTEIEKKWKKDKGKQYTWLGYISNHIYLILFSIATFLTLYGFIRFRKRIRDYQDEEM